MNPPRETSLASREGAREAALREECRRLTRYLIGQKPTALLESHYVRYHAGERTLGASRLDDALLSLARCGRIGLSLADAFAGRFSRAGRLRKKLVLTLALLESTAPHHREIDRSRGGSFVAVGLRLGLPAVLRLAVSIPVVAMVFAFRVCSPGREGIA